MSSKRCGDDDFVELRILRRGRDRRRARRQGKHDEESKRNRDWTHTSPSAGISRIRFNGFATIGISGSRWSHPKAGAYVSFDRRICKRTTGQATCISLSRSVEFSRSTHSPPRFTRQSRGTWCSSRRISDRSRCAPSRANSTTGDTAFVGASHGDRITNHRALLHAAHGGSVRRPRHARRACRAGAGVPRWRQRRQREKTGIVAVEAAAGAFAIRPGSARASPGARHGRDGSATGPLLGACIPRRPRHGARCGSRAPAGTRLIIATAATPPAGAATTLASAGGDVQRSARQGYFLLRAPGAPAGCVTEPACSAPRSASTKIP